MLASISLLVLLFPAARAQDEGAGQDQHVDIELFRPPADAMGYLSVPSASTLGHLQIGGSFWTSYANDPVVLVYDGTRIAPVSAVVQGDDGDGIVDDRLAANAQFGIGLSRFFSLTIDVPMVMWQDGYDVNTIDDPSQEPVPLTTASVGDVRVVPKVLALDLDQLPAGFALALPVGFPTGNGGAFLGEQAYTVQPTAIFELADGSVRKRAYAVRAAVCGGYRVRERNDVRGVELGNAIVYGVALGARPADPAELVIEFHGEVSGPDVAQQPAEVLFGLKLLPTRYISFNAGGGFGVMTGVGAPDYRVLGGISVAPSLDPCTLDRDHDGIVNCEDQCVEEGEDLDRFRDDDGCPDDDNDADGLLDEEDICPLDPEDHDGYRDGDGCPDDDNDKDGLIDLRDQCPDDPETRNAFEDEDGCPDEKPPDDTDGDGLDDVVDRCPLDPEDFDQWQDDDGCPEPDNDGDSILDAVDRCPNDREVWNGLDDEDGCPDEGRVVLEKEQIRILDRIYFEFNKSVIQERSFTLLDEIAAVILNHPELLLIRIEGHTDDVGSDAYNLKLSQARAAAVRIALAQRGVDPSRLDAAGFGESRPIAPNDTDEGRADNRRVEFIIVDRE